MNMTAFWVIIALTALEVVYRLCDLVYRILTESDVAASWKERALGDLFAFLLNLALLLWLFFG